MPDQRGPTRVTTADVVSQLNQFIGFFCKIDQDGRINVDYVFGDHGILSG